MSTPVVMVVDDEPAALAALERVLTSDLYQLVTASSGMEALALIKGLLGRSVKLLLLDLSLSDMSGFSLADQARQVIPEVKVLYVSGYSAPEEHAQHWIMKPFEVDELKGRILKELGLNGE